MDPHSTRSQFNHRTPKAGPASRGVAETSKVSSSKKSTSKPKPEGTTPNVGLIRRPIATNSRVKQDEMFKRDMYLSVVTNALHQKSIGVSDAFNELVGQFNLSSLSNASKRPATQQKDATQIRLWLVALSHIVSRLERTHATLVDAIVSMPWTALDSATVKSYTVFIGMLLSARPEYLSLVLAKIAEGFTHQSCIQALDTNMPSTSTAPLTRRTIYDRIHYLLRHLLALIPTLPSTLQPLLARHFPHKRQNQLAQTTYIRNLLRVSSYCPELSDRILATIVDRAIQMDVEIQIELEELEEVQDVEGDVFECDPFDVAVGQEPGSSADGSDAESDNDDDTFSDLSSEADDLENQAADVPTNTKQIQEMVKKLDAILVLLFEHFDRARAASVDSSNSGSNQSSFLDQQLPPLPPLEISTPLTPFLGPPYTQDPFGLTSTISQPTPIPTEAHRKDNTSEKTCKTTLRTQFHTLLSIFDRTILRTFKSRYTQFLLFWYTSLDPEFSDIFQGMLVDRALMPSSGFQPMPPALQGDDSSMSANARAHAHMLTPEVTRAAAASYIGSFVSRATFVDKDGTRSVTAVLCDYLRAHLDGVDEALRDGLVGVGAGTSAAKATIAAILASGQHTVFYAVAQAVFLIFCFRWRDLRLDGGDEQDKWMPELAVLKRAVGSILNPLKVCSANVAEQFTFVARTTDFHYCYPILDANRHRRSESGTSPPHTGAGDPSSSQSRPTHVSTPSFTSVAALPNIATYGASIADLNTFFPFDPYRLPKSSVFIQAVYRDWADVAIDDEDSEGEEDGEEETDEHTQGRSASYLDIPIQGKGGAVDDGGLGESLGAMSISPLRIAMSVSMRG